MQTLHFNWRTILQMNIPAIRNLIAQENKINQGVGVIVLHHEDLELLPIVQQAMEQLGYIGFLNSLLWSKIMPDGTRRSIVIHCYNEVDAVPLDQHLIQSRNVILLTSNTNENVKTPVVINRIFNASLRTEESYRNFDLPHETFGAAMECEEMCKVEQRSTETLALQLRNAIEATHNASKYLRSKYFVIASTHHQHQLALLIDTIASSFVTRIDKKIFIYRFNKDTPRDLPCLTEPLKAMGVESSILFNAVNDKWTCYYVYVDQLFSVLLTKFREPFAPLLPWMIGLHSPCWKFTETLLNHPDNSKISEEIRFVMGYLKRFPMLCGDPGRCEARQCDHKKLGIEE